MDTAKNAQHSSESAEWYTPNEWLDLVREVFGGTIDYDPCGCEWTQRNTVNATYFDTYIKDGIIPSSYYCNVFVNPPGSCRSSDNYIHAEEGEAKRLKKDDSKGHKYGTCKNHRSCSCALPKKFLKSSIELALEDNSVIYLSYSINTLRQLGTLLRGVNSSLYVTIAHPFKRLAYINGETFKAGRSANCDSAFICLTMFADVNHTFKELFKSTCMISSVFV